MGAMQSASVPDAAEPVKLEDAPVFVVGSMRSGSTMLRLILDSHPRIAIGAETGFMGGMLAAKTIPHWSYGKDWYHRLGWADDEFDARLRDFYAGLFERYAAEHGKARWGEKTPFHTVHMEAMARLFPSAVFVGIVRHPGAVAASLHKKFHYTFPDALDYWRATNLAMIRAVDAAPERFTLCRYEDLVRDAEPVLRELMAFLGEPWSDNLLAHHEVQQAKGAPRVVDGSTSTRDAIDSSRADEWARQAGAAERAALAGCASLAGFFGYDPTEPATLASLGDGPDAARLLSGKDLLRRRAAWSDRVDFDEQPPTLAIDASPEELARRLAQVEAALTRIRTRRAVRWVDALRKVQHGRSRADVKNAWATLRNQDM
jgi:hypothetical protein